MHNPGLDRLGATHAFGTTDFLKPFCNNKIFPLEQNIFPSLCLDIFCVLKNFVNAEKNFKVLAF